MGIKKTLQNWRPQKSLVSSHPLSLPGFRLKGFTY